MDDDEEVVVVVSPAAGGGIICKSTSPVSGVMDKNRGS